MLLERMEQKFSTMWYVVGKSGNSSLYLQHNPLKVAKKKAMTNFIGEYDSKLDDKGRLMLPSGLKKQCSAQFDGKFVVNRGLENCLVLYQKQDWEVVSGKIAKLNQFVLKNRQFIRRFNNGATSLELDSAGRLLIPKKLLEYAGITKETILFGYADKIEIWSKEAYEKMMNEEQDFAALAEEVMGKPEDDKGE